MRTRVGYAGGTTEHPTYYTLGDHSETIEIEYDSSRITYEELLDVFWSSHDPTRRAWSRQYMSIVFYHGEEQRRLAEASKVRYEAEAGGAVFTDIRPATEFYPAEDYHQKYRLRHASDVMAEFRTMYPRDEDLVASTAAARVNGYLGGHGTCGQFRDELDALGLSESSLNRVRGLVCGGG